MDFEEDIKFTFLDEARQLLEEVENCFLKLEEKPESKDALDAIFRLAHNLKGSARAVGFGHINTVAHEFETLLLKVKARGSISPELTDVMLACVDFIRSSVEILRNDLNAKLEISDIVKQLEAAHEFCEPETGGLVLFEEEEDSSRFIEVIPPSPKQEIPRDEKPSTRTQPLADSPAIASTSNSIGVSKGQQEKAPEANSKNHPEESIRVSLSRLDDLISAVGEVVILSSVLQHLAKTEKNESIQKVSIQLGKAFREIQSVSMGLRMLPLRSIFQKMRRIVRDTSSALGKQVDFITVGEETEVDKIVFEKISDPLVHLIRNAIDHGVECSNVRLNAGKPAVAQVRLSAAQRGGKLVIEVSDDGHGLNPVVIQESAVRKGMIAPGTALTDEQIYALIFKAGFSTKDTVSDVSGRGVGLDVVMTNLNDMHGEIEITAEVGKGTTFTIQLPLTLAIIDGLVIRSGGQRFIVPLSQVSESLICSPKEVRTVPGLGRIITLRDEEIFFYPFSELTSQEASQSEDLTAIIVRSTKGSFAFGVDEVIGRQQVVIKQLGPDVPVVAGISGASILSDGRPTLIVDLIEFISSHCDVNPSSTEKQVRKAA